MSKKPQNVLYAIKIFHRKTNGELVGPGTGYRYQTGKWYSIGDNTEPEICSQGFHFPSRGNLIGKKGQSWFRAYSDDLCSNVKAVEVYLIKVAGLVDFSEDKIAAQKMMLVSKIDGINSIKELAEVVDDLIGEGSTIYEPNMRRLLKRVKGRYNTLYAI